MTTYCLILIFKWERMGEFQQDQIKVYDVGGYRDNVLVTPYLFADDIIL